MRADGGKSLRLRTFNRHPTSEYNRCGMKLKGLKCLFSHYPQDSLSLTQRFDFRDSLSFILFYRHSVTHTHSCTLREEKEETCVRQHGLWLTSQSSVTLYATNTFPSLCLSPCVWSELWLRVGKFPCWVRKYNSPNNISSDKSHPVGIEVCVCVNAAHTCEHEHVYACLCI